jgi:hypothetical protein
VRVTVVAALVLAAASLTAPCCASGSTLLASTDLGVQSPGLPTELPGGNLGDLPSSLPSLSSSEPSRYGPGATGAMLEVLTNPSSLAAPPGMGPRVGRATDPRPSVMAGGSSGTEPQRSIVPGTGSSSPLRSAPDADSGSLMSASHADPGQNAAETPSGLLSNREPNPSGSTAVPQSTNPAAPGAKRRRETSSLFSSQVAIEYSSTNDARATGPSAAPGADAATSSNGPAASRSAYAAMAELRREKTGSFSTRLTVFGLAFLGLVIAPFAVSLLRRGLT